MLCFHSLWWFRVQCHLLVLVHCVFWKPTSLHPLTNKCLGTTCFLLLTSFFQQDSAPAHTAKSTKSWFYDHGVGVLDWPANSPDLDIENIWVIVKRKMRNKRPKMQMSWSPLSKKPGLPYHLSSATNWSPPCHAKLRQQLMQKEPLPSIEYKYSKWTNFPEGQQFTQKKKYWSYEVF